MGDQPQRDVKKAELSLLKLLFPLIYGEHEECWLCAISKNASDSIYPLSLLTKVGEDHYCSEHVPLNGECSNHPQFSMKFSTGYIEQGADRHILPWYKIYHEPGRIPYSKKSKTSHKRSWKWTRWQLQISMHVV